MCQGFAGNVALHLGLVDGVDGSPHHTATDYNGPESVSLQRVWIKTIKEKGKKEDFSSEISFLQYNNSKTCLFTCRILRP